MISRRGFVSSLAAAAAAPAAAPKRPNIILILADDMGFSDIGCYGGEIRTPNIDSLARGGVRFTQFYNTARCCPTRSSLMTGLYPHQAGVGHMVDNPQDFPAYRGDLSRNAVTIAETLRPAGYRTAMSGKWHVTPLNQSKHNWPLQRGFERYYGTIHGAGSFFDPTTLVSGNDTVRPDTPDYYYTDAVAGHSCRVIDEFAQGQSPFFLYTAFTSPHWPMHALQPDIDRYRGRYKDGWDALRIERHKRMVDMGIVNKRWPLTPRDATVPAWADEPNRAWQERRMEVYAAMVDRMDQGIGRMMERLRANGIENDTLVMFLSDNGGCAEELRVPASGIHVPKKTRSGAPVFSGNDASRMPGGEDTYQSYGKGWANASNTPFRLYKHWVHEGGIATPFIARWPERIRRTGGFIHQPGHLIDVMSTCVELSGASYPSEAGGNRIQPQEGVSLARSFEGKTRRAQDALYWEHEGNRAVREGRWKLVSKYPDQWELFDLDADRTEVNDLAARMPDRAARLAAKYEAWAARCGVQPWDRVRPRPRA